MGVEYERKTRLPLVGKKNIFAADQFSRGTSLWLVVPLKCGITMPAADRGEIFQRDARGDGEDAFVGKNDGSIIFESLGFQFTMFTLCSLFLVYFLFYSIRCVSICVRRSSS